MYLPHSLFFLVNLFANRQKSHCWYCFAYLYFLSHKTLEGLAVFLTRVALTLLAWKPGSKVRDRFALEVS